MSHVEGPPEHSWDEMINIDQYYCGPTNNDVKKSRHVHGTMAIDCTIQLTTSSVPAAISAPSSLLSRTWSPSNDISPPKESRKPPEFLDVPCWNSSSPDNDRVEPTRFCLTSCRFMRNLDVRMEVILGRTPQFILPLSVIL